MATAFSNLYRVHFIQPEGKEGITSRPSVAFKDLSAVLIDSLKATGWYVDRVPVRAELPRIANGPRCPYRIALAASCSSSRLTSFQFHQCFGALYLSIDYTLEVKNVRNVHQLLGDMAPSDLTAEWPLPR